MSFEPQPMRRFKGLVKPAAVWPIPLACACMLLAASTGLAFAQQSPTKVDLRNSTKST